MLSSADLHTRLAGIHVMAFDVDGVMTDGSLNYDANGESFKTFNVLDGMGIVLLRQAGIESAIVTGRTSEIVKRRAEDLGIRLVIQGSRNKGDALEEMMAFFKQPAHAFGFMGDDWIDISLMRKVGFAATVPGASDEVTRCAQWTAKRSGGKGAVREVCDLLLAAHGKLDATLTGFGA